MSRVCLIAADKPLPLCDRQSERTSTVRSMDKDFTITALRGFRVAEHRYYRAAVELLGYPMKPHQYELELEQHPDDLAHLLEYLRSNFSTGETVELWNVWVGADQCRPVRYSGTLAEFDMETLEQFWNPPERDGAPGQCCLTVRV